MTRGPHRQAGLSIFEVTLVVILVGILMVIAMEKILRLDVDAERVGMQRMIGQLQSALVIEFADRVVHDGLAATRDMEAINPMSVLAKAPATYIGEFDQSVPPGVAGGDWYFDTRSRTLVYVVRNTEFFEGVLGDPERARFRVRLAFEDRNGNGRYDAPRERIEGVIIEPVEPHRWKRPA